jgi:NAD(P)-dependent dehydrogenase (short-subunit alcohol dehydrogenase family)
MTYPTFTRETTGAQIVDAFADQVEGRTFLITGASDGGIGGETAVTLARGAPAQIFLLARSPGKVNPIIEKINKVNSNIKVTFISIELDDFDSVRSAAKEIHAATDKIDVIINCAGIMALPEFTTNKNGIEQQFAINHLGHFLLTALIFDKVAAAGHGARINNVTSDGYKLGTFRGDDYNFQDGAEYNAWNGYGQSKTANILFTRSLASKLADRGIVSLTTHPGVIPSSNIGRTTTTDLFDNIQEIAVMNTGEPFIMGEPKTIEQGTATGLVAALDPRLASKSGSYLEDCAIQPLRDYASSAENAQQLWALSEKLVGQKFDI